MGFCSFCGKKAAWLSDFHPECKQKSESGWKRMITLTTAAARHGGLVSVRARLAEIAQNSFLGADRVFVSLITGYEQAVASALEDGILTSEEQLHLQKYAEANGLHPSDLNGNGAYTRVMRAGIVREVLNGQIPNVTVTGHLPFNFQIDERFVCAFMETSYMEIRTVTHYVGGSAGMSVRVMKGIYFRTSSFRGRPVQKSSMKAIDSGSLAMTDRHLYFAGKIKAFRLPFKKIVSFVAYSDGIGLYRDSANPKQQVFVTGDGWATYNLAINLARMQAAADRSGKRSAL